MLPHRQALLDLLDDVADGLESRRAMVRAHGDAERRVPDSQLPDAVDDGDCPQSRLLSGLAGDPDDHLIRARVGRVGDGGDLPSAVVVAHHALEGDDGACRPVLNGSGQLGDRDRLADHPGPRDARSCLLSRFSGVGHARSSQAVRAHDAGCCRGGYTPMRASTVFRITQDYSAFGSAPVVIPVSRLAAPPPADE